MRPVEIERVLHHDAELLRGRDLRAQVHSDAERMQWHQRAVHDAVGAVLGLVVRPDGFSGVRVSSGVGYDPCGREVVLAQEAQLPLPEDIHHVWALLLRSCGKRAPRLEWVQVDRMRRCDGVPLAQWSAGKGGGLKPWPGRTRPLARPRFASGATLPGSTAWAPWLALERQMFAFGLEVRVDTSAAGFAGLPLYFAWLQWPGIADRDPRVAIASLGFQHVADETPDGFTFRVMVAGQTFRLLASSSRLDDAIVTWARSERLTVAWVGLDEDDDDDGSGP
jgi:hypothetical protein